MEHSQAAPTAPDASGLSVHYRLLHEIGRGALSTVWEAVDARTGRRVAIKVLSVPKTMGRRERAARMEREARAVSLLAHPNIVTIYEVGHEDGQPFLVMELLAGQTLRERLHKGPLPVEEAARVLDQAAAGLDAVHAAGIIHRDIKPSAFRLLPDGTTKLMDFGLARQDDDTIVTQADMLVGSPTYMAPELINDDAASPAGDIWALGVILYEMLAGRPPFAGPRLAQVLEQITIAEPRPLPTLPRSVQKVLRRALAKDPGSRYPSAGELAREFRAALSGLPPTVPSPAPAVSSAPADALPPASPASAPPPRLAPRRFPPRLVLVALAVVAVLALLIWAFR